MIFNMKRGDILIVDACYIKGVYGDYGDRNEPRFDGLKCAKTLWEGDDGVYTIMNGDKELCRLGVDSGRIWALTAEFEIRVDIDSGFSGEYILSVGEKNVEATLKKLRVK